MARSNPVGTMNSKRYTVENGGKFETLNSCNSPVGVAVAAYSLKRPISWVANPNPAPYASHTIVNGNINVYEHRL